jgi:hypothetical protein
VVIGNKSLVVVDNGALFGEGKNCMPARSEGGRTCCAILDGVSCC